MYVYILFCQDYHTQCQPCTGNSTQFRLWIVVLGPIEFYEVENNTLPVGIVPTTVYPKKYAHGFVVLWFVVVMQSFIMNSHEVFIHIHQGCFAGTGAIVRLPQCQWSKPDGYGKISQCITTTKHSKATNVCIFLGIYCIPRVHAECSYRWAMGCATSIHSLGH